MLVAESIAKSYPTRAGDLVVLRDVALTLGPGESVAILGPSGSGKSTLLNILGTLEPPTAGRVTLEGCDPFALGERELARFRNERVGFVFQDHHLLPQCSVLENVLLPTLARRAAPRGSDSQSRASARSSDAIDRARELLERVGLAERIDHLPAELSGGEKQRTAIARALINRPRLVLADEPTGNLDRATAESIAELLVELPRAREAMLIVVTHSEMLAARFDRRLVLQGGQLAPQAS